jgi:hypothetical protein
MTYRGIYRDGIVILQGDVDLRNGASVDVNASRAGKGGARRVARAQTKPRKGDKSGKSSAHAGVLSGFGIWKDRWPKSMSSAEIARKLRDQVSRRTK